MRTKLKAFLLILCTSISIISFAENNKENLKNPKDTSSTKKGAEFLELSANKMAGALGLIDQEDEVHNGKTVFQGLKYSGYVRLWGFYRNMQERYNIPAPENRGLSYPVNLSVGDGYQEPLGLFRIEANPTSSTWFQMEYYFGHRMGRGFEDPNNRQFSNGYSAMVYRIFQFTGGVHTKFGSFKLIAGGGANWYKLSPFTMWQFQYRDDMFERYPWEPQGNDWGRYSSFYNEGDIARDVRWGKRATQGFILEASNLPGGFGATVLYGKNANSSGFQSYLSGAPRNMFSGRVTKHVGSHTFGFNYFDDYGYTENSANIKKFKVFNEDRSDSSTYKVETNKNSLKILSMDARVNFRNIKLFGEFGAGSYLSENYNDSLPDKITNMNARTDKIHNFARTWTPMGLLEAKFSESLFQIPGKLTMFYIGRRVVNNTSVIQNTSIESIKPDPETPDEFNVNYFDGMVTEIDQWANNRKGIQLKLNKSLGDWRLGLGYKVSQENKNLYDSRVNDSIGHAANGVTFQHRLNALSRSRFQFYQRFSGAYGRISHNYRRTFEFLPVTDPDSTVDYKKAFNVLDFSLKYKTRLFGRELILSNYINYNSAQDFVSGLPVFSDDAFLRYFYEEFLAFYHIHPKVTVIGFGGFERARGNERTILADENGDETTDPEEGNPINQYGYGWGYGIDYNFKTNATLHLRHRFYDHEDMNFTRDKFRGNEITLEMKIFF